jgi:hypothetical protein
MSSTSGREMPTLSELVVVVVTLTTISINSFGDRLTHKMSRMVDSRILGEAGDCGWPASSLRPAQTVE